MKRMFASSVVFAGLVTIGVGQGASSAPKVAFVKGAEVYSVHADGSNLKQLTNDNVPKGLVRWSRDGSRLAYTSKGDPSKELARLVVLSSAGEKQKEISFREKNGSPVGGMRFVERLDWLPGGRIGLYGSVNPRTCEYVVLDVDSGGEVEHFLGKCGSFLRSPDGRNIAYQCAQGIGQPPKPYRDCLKINGQRMYPESEHNSRIIGSPVWSPDGHRVGLLGESGTTGLRQLVVADSSGVVAEVPLSSEHIRGGLDLAWPGESLLLAAGGEIYQVDVGMPIPAPATDRQKLLYQLKRTALTRQARDHARVRRLVHSLGGKAWDLWPGGKLPLPSSPLE